MVTQGKAKSRVISFDVVRALAVFLVVLCHAAEAIYPNEVLTNNHSKLIFIITFTIGRIGVPFFLFLTGALVLKKRIDSDKDVLHFYKKNLLSLFIVNTVWIVLYNLYFLVCGQGDKATLDAFFRELFLVDLVPVPNMWYMPMILGVYVAIPFVAKIAKSFSKKGLALASVVVFAACFVVPLINVILQICGVDSKQLLLHYPDVSFLGGVYGLYIFVGYWLASKEIEIKLKTIWLLLIALLSFDVTCLIQFISFSEGSHYIYCVWYNFPFLLVCGACLFETINRFDYKKISKRVLSVINFISRASLGIFFLHIVTQQLMYYPIATLGIMLPVKLIILTILNFILCVVVCYLLSKIKFIGRWVLLIK